MVRLSEERGSVKYGRTVKTVRPIHKNSTLKILILNLMPNKIETENQFKKLFGKIDSQIELTFLRTATYESKNTPKSYLLNHYKTLSEVSLDQFDGFICTGSPVETLPFEAVEYWDELMEIFEAINKNGILSYYICWGAQAVLNYRYGIQKVLLPEKQFGVYIHKVSQKEISNYIGFSDEIPLPVSRYTGTIRKDIEANPNLEILLDSHNAGVSLVSNNSMNEFYNFNHFEYDTDTLKKEYIRDLNNGLYPNLPENYFPNNDTKNEPVNIWAENAITFFNYWLLHISS